MKPDNGSTARLLITCPDQPGIVAAVSGFMHQLGANIITSDQHSSDHLEGTFFMRLEFYLPGIDLKRMAELKEAFQKEVADPFSMDWSLNPSWVRKKVAILASREDHALMDILWRWRRGELYCDITMVVANHPDLREAVQSFGVAFHHVPVADPAAKPEAEAHILRMFEGNADLVLLARYMQILSTGFVDRFPNRIINIHHSFLPAFVGADPYRRAAERGVKLIGATAHYVTEELDEGPIIDQDVIRVSHRNSLEDLKVLGRDIERQVFSRAVKWHLEDRVIVDGNKTIVFV